MSKFRKKPVVIEATQWFKNGDHPADDVMRPFEDTGKSPTEPREGVVVRYFRHPGVDGNRSCEFCNATMHHHGWIDTLEGGHIVCPGDWIITGVKGERYPCKPNIFALSYDAAETPQAPALLPPLNEELNFILGMVCFRATPISRRLHNLGLYQVKTHAEEEQAACIHWMLNLYLQHPTDWRKRADEILASSATHTPEAPAPVS